MPAGPTATGVHYECCCGTAARRAVCGLPCRACHGTTCRTHHHCEQYVSKGLQSTRGYLTMPKLMRIFLLRRPETGDSRSMHIAAHHRVNGSVVLDNNSSDNAQTPAGISNSGRCCHCPHSLQEHIPKLAKQCRCLWAVAVATAAHEHCNDRHIQTATADYLQAQQAPSTQHMLQHMAATHSTGLRHLQTPQGPQVLNNKLLTDATCYVYTFTPSGSTRFSTSLLIFSA